MLTLKSNNNNEFHPMTMPQKAGKNKLRIYKCRNVIVLNENLCRSQIKPAFFFYQFYPFSGNQLFPLPSSISRVTPSRQCHHRRRQRQSHRHQTQSLRYQHRSRYDNFDPQTLLFGQIDPNKFGSKFKDIHNDLA